MIFAALKKQPANKLALHSHSGTLSYGQLTELVEKFSQWLKKNAINSVALSCDNSFEWVVVDLACQHAGVVFTAIPLFFSEKQVDHLVKTARPDIILSDKKMTIASAVSEPILQLYAYQMGHQESAILPQLTSKITYTSGSTGQPKGVCLSVEQQLNVAQSLVAVAGLHSTKHLCLLPLSTLLENIAGIYSPLLVGGSIYLSNDQERGFSGSRLTNPQQLFACITQVQPNSLILVPELLQVLLHGAGNGWQVPESLKFIAVGGGKVSKALIDRARALGLPVYQGYGLSECGSVVSLQTPESSTGSVGKLLPHLSAQVINRQLVVYGNTFLGYLNEPDSWGADCVYTGDLGEICNAELFINGRQKNLIINSFGRNISPEWVEAELLATGLLQQAVLIGDSKPYCIALLVPLSAQITLQQLSAAINRVNQGLPDYAQVKEFIRLEQAMRYEQGLITENGRPKRQNISHHFAQQINHLYEKSVCE